MDLSAIEDAHHPGTLTGYTCPECKGPLWEIQDGKLVRFRCRVGHAYTAETVLAGKDTEVEDAFWGAINSLEESAQLSRSMALRARQHGHTHLVPHYEARAARDERRLEVLRSVLVRGQRPVPDEGAYAALDAEANEEADDEPEVSKRG